MLDQLCNLWSVEGSNSLVFSLAMARTNCSTRKGPREMICIQKIATRDACLPPVERPRAPTAVTTADVNRNEACAPACTATVAMLRSITDPVDGKCLKLLLGKHLLLLTRRTGGPICCCYAHLGFGCCFGPDRSKQLPM